MDTSKEIIQLHGVNTGEEGTVKLAESRGDVRRFVSGL